MRSLLQWPIVLVDDGQQRPATLVEFELRARSTGQWVVAAQAVHDRRDIRRRGATVARQRLPDQPTRGQAVHVRRHGHRGR